MAKGNKGTILDIMQKEAKNGGICKKCNQMKDILTVDHIIPLSILKMLDESGRAFCDWEENLEFLCYVCNRFKADRLDKRHPKTKELLLKLLN